MVCPRLRELDERHADHLAADRHPYDPNPDHTHGPDCDCLYDPEGHRVTTLVMPPGSEIEDDHPALNCPCGRQMVIGEVVRSGMGL